MTVNEMTNETNREEEVRRLVYDWFSKITFHAPLDSIVVHFIDDSPKMHMHFPEQEVNTLADFGNWYSAVINTYFDQSHVVKSLNIEIDGELARVDVQVEWHARSREAPNPRSTNIRMDAFQHWLLRYSSDARKWGIKNYYVENLYDVATVVP